MSSCYILSLLFTHLDKPTGTLFLAFIATFTKFQFEPIWFARYQGLDDRLILTVTPAGSTVETGTAAHAAFCLGDDIRFS